MIKFQLPYVKMPEEYVTLLKSNLSVTTSPAPIFDELRSNRALMMILENAFKEFDDGRGVEKVMLALGWANFRDRMASLFVYKMIYGDYPMKTDMELVEDIKFLEHQYSDHAVHSFSRLFLLGFYLKLANLQVRERENNQFLEIKIPTEIGTILKFSQGRSERIDWLILILTHLHHFLGEKLLVNSLISGKKFDDIYGLLPTDARELMHQNLLAYGASINESDVFLYDKI